MKYLVVFVSAAVLAVGAHADAQVELVDGVEPKDWLALILGALTLGVTSYIAFVAHRFSRRSATLQALSNLSAEIAGPDLQLSLKFPAENVLSEEDAKAILSDPRDAAAALAILNAYEFLARGVLSGLFDTDLVRATRGGALTGTYNRFRLVIDRRRSGFPEAWEALVALAKQWQPEKRER